MAASSLKLTDFDVISIIGTGSSGTCFKVKNKYSGEIFVWKSIGYDQISEEKKNIILTEINLLRELKHPNIVRYFDHIIYNETKTLYIIMECCDGGDLGKLIKKCKKNQCHFEEEFIWRVLYQLSKALQGCHSHKTTITVLHRDIKPANVFLDIEGNVKLGDFGLARVLHSEHDTFAETLVGTPYYMSPEIIKGVKYNRKSDIWSLGCLIYEMCALDTPFTGQKFEQLSKNINDGSFKRIPDIYSDDLQKIITFMLSVDHGCRPTVDILLHHPTVLTNLSKTNQGFPCLICDPIKTIEKSSSKKVLKFNPNPNLTSTITQDLSMEILKSTPVLREEIFGSASRKMSNEIATTSDPEDFLITKKVSKIIGRSASDEIKYSKQNIITDPNEITQEIFDHALRQRLHAIRAKESLLKQKENELNEKEQQLIKREKLLLKNERNIRTRRSRSASSRTRQRNKFIINESSTTIEPNDTVIIPTVAKFNPEQIPRPKILQNKIQFKSPQKFKNYNIENIPPPSTASFQNLDSRQLNYPMKYTQKDLENAVIKNFATISTAISPSKNLNQQNLYDNNSNKIIHSNVKDKTKRKSIFSNLFNLNKNSDINRNSIVTTITSSSCSSTATTANSNSIKSSISTNSEIISSKWNAETKKTAFEMLAILNSADDKQKLNNDVVLIENKIIQRDRRRKSMIIYRKNTNL